MFVLIKLSIFSWYAKIVHGITVEKVKSKRELDTLYALRKEVYTEEGYAEGAGEDIYDQHSVHFLALKGKTPVGACRLVLDSSEGFPVERFFNIEHPSIPRNQIAEVSRLAIRKEWRGGKRVASRAVFAQIYMYAMKNDVYYFYVAIKERMQNSLQELGISFMELEVAPPADSHLRERSLHHGYFSHGEVKPYLIELKRISY